MTVTVTVTVTGGSARPNLHHGTFGIIPDQEKSTPPSIGCNTTDTVVLRQKHGECKKAVQVSCLAGSFRLALLVLYDTGNEVLRLGYFVTLCAQLCCVTESE